MASDVIQRLESLLEYIDYSAIVRSSKKKDYSLLRHKKDKSYSRLTLDVFTDAEKYEMVSRCYTDVYRNGFAVVYQDGEPCLKFANDRYLLCYSLTKQSGGRMVKVSVKPGFKFGDVISLDRAVEILRDGFLAFLEDALIVKVGYNGPVEGDRMTWQYIQDKGSDKLKGYYVEFAKMSWSKLYEKAQRIGEEPKPIEY